MICRSIFIIAFASLLASNQATASTIFTSDTDGNIYRYTGSGSGSLFYGYEPGAAATSQLSFGPGAMLYAILSNSTIDSFNETGQRTTVLNNFPSPILGFTFNSNGNVFTSDTDGNIYRYTGSGSGSLFYGYEPGAAATSQLSFGPGGMLYAILSNSAIAAFNETGQRTIVLNNFPSPILGFTFNSNGNIFTSDTDGNIYRYTDSGSRSLFYGYQPGAAATSQLSFGPDGSLYAILSNSTIDSFNEMGDRTVVLDNVPSPIVGFAFQPVPEPSTLAYLGLGAFFSVLLCRALRRRKE